ncbi:hypothetical protein SDC9_103837 [bioreactor metagenome]|uniref:Uncharacterized protein n=1 Tax=bioreactor metagenome TaxID=1076179 RepID=A0A645AV54_9ZZZZ
MVQDEIQLLEVRQQILHPKRCPLAHRHQLRGLIVGVTQRGHGFVFFREPAQIPQDRAKLAPEVLQSVPVEDEVGVVGDVAAGSPQVDDASGGGRGLSEGIYVGHHVVADFLFPLRGAVIVDVGDVGGQLVHLRLRYRKAQRVFRPGQLHPQLPPRLIAGVGGKQAQHIVGGVPRRQGGFIAILAHSKVNLSE